MPTIISMKKYTILFYFLFLLIIGCQQKSKNDLDSKVDSIKNTISNSRNAKNSLDYIGTYKGILPCADCDGIETKIRINENLTFCILTKYQGKGTNVYELKGNYSWNNAENTIILNTVENAPNQYFVGKNTLTQLDVFGKKITGDLAASYVLTKQANNLNEIDSIEENTTSKVNLNNRMEVTTMLQKVNPSDGKFTLAETKWELVVLDKKVVTRKGKKAYFLKLNSKDGKFTAFAGCNVIKGKYVMPSANTLSFFEIVSTTMACSDMMLETNFLSMLEKSNNYLLDKESLILVGKGKQILARFEAIK